MIDIGSFSDDVLLDGIQPQNVHADSKSKEEFTNKIQKKYKLVADVIRLHDTLVFYHLFVLTRNNLTCQTVLTVSVQKEEWENRSLNELHENYSYIDIRKMETLAKDVVLEKIKDVENGFSFVGRLPDFKQTELEGKVKYLNHAKKLSEDKAEVIRAALTGANIPERILDKLFKKDV